MDGGNRTTVQHNGPFYAYIINFNDDNTWRTVLIFASRAVADEWWRAVSTSNSPQLQAGAFRRVTPQLYTHNPGGFNVHNFFIDGAIKAISEPFRGKLFLQLQNDRLGRGIDIIPAQTIVDHGSGDWFSIRSKADARKYWYYDEASQSIRVSETRRSAFQVTAPGIQKGMIMIGTDDITIRVQKHGYVVLTTRGNAGERAMQVTPNESDAFNFKFSDLAQGRFAPYVNPWGAQVSDADSHVLCYNTDVYGGAGWELAL
jgi:hypothetical protein